MPPRRSNIDILKQIKNYINDTDVKEFHKSAIRDSKGDVSPNTVENLCRLVEFCQTEMPSLHVKKIGSSVIIEVKQENRDINI